MSEKGAALDPSAYRSHLKPIWCPGCGHYGALSALCRAMAECRLDRWNTVVISGIGCSSRLPGFLNTYGFHGVHGRALPVATGVRIANPNLKVIVVSGDGDAYSIGAGHLLHCARRNPRIACIVLNNGVYGLTKGQISPTSPLPLASEGPTSDPRRWKTTPYGATETPINAVAQAIAWDTSFVARGFSYDQPGLTSVLVGALRHPGFALVDVLSPCPTWNQVQTEAFCRERVHPVPPGYDPTDRVAAFAEAIRNDVYTVGVLYRSRSRIHGIEEETASVRAAAMASSGGMQALLESLRVS